MTGGIGTGLCARVPSGTELMRIHFFSEQSSETWMEIIQSHFKVLETFPIISTHYDPILSHSDNFSYFHRKFFVISVHEAVFCNLVPLDFGFSLHAIDPFDFI